MPVHDVHVCEQRVDQVELVEARARTYAAVELIEFPGMQYRTDVALEALEMEEL